MSESTAKLVLDISTGKAQADVAKLVQSFSDLGKETKKAKGEGEGFVKQLKDVSTAANQTLEVFGKVAVAIGKAVDFADETIRLSAEFKRLNDAIPSANLDRFRIASKGTVDNFTLLQTASKAMTGQFRLTTAGVQELLTAATNLSQKGFGGTIEIFNKLDMSLKQGSSGGLREFGIALQDVNDKNKNVKDMLEALHREASKKIDVNPSVDAINKLETATKNWWAGFKADVGSVFGLIAQGIVAASDDISKRSKRLESAQDTASAVNQHAVRPEQSAARAFRQIKGYGFNPAGNGDPSDPGFESVIQNQKDAELYRSLVQQAMEVQRQVDIKKAVDAARGLAGLAVVQSGTILGLGKTPLTAGKQEFEGEYKMHQAAPAELDFAGDYKRTRYYNNGPGNVEREGPKTGADQYRQVTDNLKDQNTALGAGFSTLQSGISAAVDAAISGSDSIGKAFAKASAAALKSIAIESTVRALYETAVGFSMLFIPGGQAAAAGHFKSAAVFAAAAAAAGLGSAALSALGGGGGSSAGGGGTPNSTGVNQQPVNAPQAQTINVYVSGAITAGSYAELGQTIQKATQLGQQAGRVRTSDSVTVSWE